MSTVLLHTFPAKRQGAPADEQHRAATKILPLNGLARCIWQCKQDPIKRGHGAQYEYRPLPWRITSITNDNFLRSNVVMQQGDPALWADAYQWTLKAIDQPIPNVGQGHLGVWQLRKLACTEMKVTLIAVGSRILDFGRSQSHGIRATPQGAKRLCGAPLACVTRLGVATVMRRKARLFWGW